MKVKELIERLKEFDPECEVIMSRDPEGSVYSPLDDIEDYIYFDRDIYLEELTPELIEEGYGEEDLAPSEDAKLAVVFWPKC